MKKLARERSLNLQDLPVQYRTGGPSIAASGERAGGACDLIGLT